MTYIPFLFAKSQTWQLIWNEKLTSEGIRCTIGAYKYKLKNRRQHPRRTDLLEENGCPPYAFIIQYQKKKVNEWLIRGR